MDFEIESSGSNRSDNGSRDNEGSITDSETSDEDCA